MGICHSRTEKQVFDYTVLTFNRLLGYVQKRDFLAPEDYHHIGSKFIRLYQMWDVAWKKGEMQKLNHWKKLFRWAQSSGILGRLRVLYLANEGVRGEILWRMMNSEEVLLWVLDELGLDVEDVA